MNDCMYILLPDPKTVYDSKFDMFTTWFSRRESVIKKHTKSVTPNFK